MPDEQGDSKADEETLPDTPLHAHAADSDGDEDDIEGQVGSGEHQDADQAENTGGATSGEPGGGAQGEEDPSEV